MIENILFSSIPIPEPDDKSGENSAAGVMTGSLGVSVLVLEEVIENIRFSSVLDDGDVEVVVEHGLVWVMVAMRVSVL